MHKRIAEIILMIRNQFILIITQIPIDPGYIINVLYKAQANVAVAITSELHTNQDAYFGLA